MTNSIKAIVAWLIMAICILSGVVVLNTAINMQSGLAVKAAERTTVGTWRVPFTQKFLGSKVVETYTAGQLELEAARAKKWLAGGVLLVLLGFCAGAYVSNMSVTCKADINIVSPEEKPVEASGKEIPNTGTV